MHEQCVKAKKMWRSGGETQLLWAFRIFYATFYFDLEHADRLVGGNLSVCSNPYSIILDVFRAMLTAHGLRSGKHF